MKKRVYDIQNLSCSPLNENPFLFEIAMEEYVIEHPDLLWLSDDLSSPVVTGYEIAKSNKRYDIVAKYADDTTGIIEVKKGELSTNSLDQLNHYLQYNKSSEEPFVGDVIGVLLGTSIDPKVVMTIEKSQNMYAIILSRFDSNNMETVATTIYGPKKPQLRDRSTYTLQNLQNVVINHLRKGTLVYEIIRSYIEANPNITIEKLQEVFPKSLAGRKAKSSQEIIHRNNISVGNNLFGRYFKEPLSCADGEVLISNQWGIGNIQLMIDKANELHMKINQ